MSPEHSAALDVSPACGSTVFPSLTSLACFATVVTDFNAPASKQ